MGVFLLRRPALIATVLAVSVALLAACGGGDGGPTPTGTPTTQPTPTSTSTQAFATNPPLSDDGLSPDDPIALGDAAVLGGSITVRVEDVSLNAERQIIAFDDQNEATPGQNMVLASVEVNNIGDSAIDLGADLFWSLVGEKGIEYDGLAMDCGHIPDELTGELPSGQSASGNVCVQADEDDSDLVLIVDMFDDQFNLDRRYLALE